MTTLDLIALVIIAGSTLAGVLRGFIREAFSLGAWVLAFFAARFLSPLAVHLIPDLGSEGPRYAAAIVLVFLVVLIGASFAGVALSGLVRLAGLGDYDKTLGAAFGLARALILLVLLAVLAGLTALPRTELWRSSLAHRPLEIAALSVKPMLPPKLGELVRFN